MLNKWTKVFLVLFTMTFIGTVLCNAQQSKKYTPQSYVQTHKDAAQQLMRETGVPASVILAVAFHESAYGNSRVAHHLNNHFGIKGKNSNTTIKSAYKDYDSVVASYRDFVGLLQRRRSTQPLFYKHDSQDYKAWVQGIARAGYSETGDWSRKVLATIDRYDLDQYDEKVNLN